MIFTVADPGIRIPRSILLGNTIDLGNYHQCLGIRHDVGDMSIKGKYCMIQVPSNQSFHLPLNKDMEASPWFDSTSFNVDEIIKKNIEKASLLRRQLQMIAGVSEYDSK